MSTLFLLNNSKEERFLVEYTDRIISHREQELLQLRQSKHNTVNLGELNYEVVNDFLYKGWITAIKKTENGLRYHVKYEDKETNELTLEELNDPSITLVHPTSRSIG